MDLLEARGITQTSVDKTRGGRGTRECVPTARGSVGPGAFPGWAQPVPQEGGGPGAGWGPGRGRWRRWRKGQAHAFHNFCG